MSLILRTHNGFGDVIYYRPVIREYAKRPGVYLATAFPELFRDLGIPMVRARSGLSWSNRNMDQNAALFVDTPDVPSKDIRIRHFRAQLKSRSMIEVMARNAGVMVGGFDLPPLPASPVQAERIAVIRPVTVRPDWPHPARNPLPEYVCEAAEILKESGYHVVSVAAISEAEPYMGPPPFAHTRFDRGELAPLELLALIKAASVVVTGPGWPVPAALACGTPLITIGGGAGLTNGKTALVPSWYGGNVQWLGPSPQCPCGRKRHKCNKVIPHFARQFTEALERDRSLAA